MRVVVAGWIGSTNLGDELIYAALVRKLRDRGVEPVAISVDPAATTRTHGTPAISASDPIAQWRAVTRSDALLVGGGGLLQDETSPLNLPYHLARTLPWRLRQRPVGFVGLGVGALDTRLGRGLVRAGVAARWPVAVRDQASADLLASLGRPDAVVAADLVLSGSATRRTWVDDEVVVSLRPQVARGRLLSASRRWRRGMADPAWVAGLAASLDRVAETTGLAIRLVAFQPDRDGPLHTAVADRMRTEVTCETVGVADAAARLARARLVVGMRFHACVLATLGGVPSVALAYSDKVRSLAQELGPGGAATPPTVAGLAEVPALAAGVLGHDTEVAAAAARLRVREAGNDRVLDQVLGG